MPPNIIHGVRKCKIKNICIVHCVSVKNILKVYMVGGVSVNVNVNKLGVKM
jgi:hypothetical protein